MYELGSGSSDRCTSGYASSNVLDATARSGQGTGRADRLGTPATAGGVVNRVKGGDVGVGLLGRGKNWESG